MTCERPVRWSVEPEMTAWMLEHDGGRPVPEVIADFEREFGFRLAREQVSLFRSSHGTQSRRSHGGGKPRRPVGYEREVKGYVVVKVAEEATVPQSKDNWKLKHVLVWEREHGRELPEGWTVLFLDHDRRNFDPGNLYAIPRKYIAQINLKASKGAAYRDCESLEALMALCDLDTAILDAENRKRRCALCGREFEPDEANRYGRQLSCRSCLDAGHKASWANREPKGEAVCEVCSRRFVKWFGNQKRCSNCTTARYARKA